MECADLKHEKEALEFLAKKGGFVQTSEERITRTREQLDKYLLPHIGMDEKSRLLKAYALCKLIKKFLMITEDGKEQEDKDHFMNKRLKLSGDLLSDLFRINLRNMGWWQERCFPEHRQNKCSCNTLTFAKSCFVA